MTIARVVVDVESVGLPIDPEFSSALTARCEGEEDVAKVLDTLALSPLTGMAVAIGMLNPATGAIRQYCQPEHTEAACLLQFWHDVAKFGQIITFNGRGFDIPFLMIRSAILKVKCSRNDLIRNRFKAFPHCDLLDQLTFYGVTRKFSLDVYCRAFGIPSPKQNGDGGTVETLWKEKQFDKIAVYNAGDLTAEAALFERWQNFIAGSG